MQIRLLWLSPSAGPISSRQCASWRDSVSANRRTISRFSPERFPATSRQTLASARSLARELHHRVIGTGAYLTADTIKGTGCCPLDPAGYGVRNDLLVWSLRSCLIRGKVVTISMRI